MHDLKPLPCTSKSSERLSSPKAFQDYRLHPQLPFQLTMSYVSKSSSSSVSFFVMANLKQLTRIGRMMMMLLECVYTGQSVRPAT